MLVATPNLFLLKDPAATSHLIKKLAYFKTKDFDVTQIAYHNLVIRLESSCCASWDSHMYKTMSLRSKIESPRSTFKLFIVYCFVCHTLHKAKKI